MAYNDVNVFEEPKPWRDLALDVEDKRFWVVRGLLSLYSPVFKAMIYEASGKINKVISLPDKKAADIYELLLCLLPTPTIKSIDFPNVELMLAFADEYQIKDLQTRSHTFLTRQLDKCEKSDKALLNILRLASKYRIRSLLESCVARCAEEFSREELESSIPNLRNQVIAALMIRKSAVDQKWHHYLLQDTVCKIDHGYKSVLECVYCAYQYCTVCNNFDKSALHCHLHEKVTEGSVSILLDNI